MSLRNLPYMVFRPQSDRPNVGGRSCVQSTHVNSFEESKKLGVKRVDVLPRLYDD